MDLYNFAVISSACDTCRDSYISVLHSLFECNIRTYSSVASFNERQDDVHYHLISHINGTEKNSLYIKNKQDTPLFEVVCEHEASRYIPESTSGINDVIYSPFSSQEIYFRVKRVLDSAHADVTEKAKKNILERLGFTLMKSVDRDFNASLEKLPPLAGTDATVLLVGETGVGKELVARAIHYLSSRSNKPFIAVNCSAIPLTLFESELFGHKKGSFTNADKDRRGLIEEAEGGTMFLDEIDSLSYEAQSKILRLLQDRLYKTVGENKDRVADVRFIAATNKDLPTLISEGKFRDDLFYRLTFKLDVPPLRERRTDIPHLARHFLTKYAKNADKIKSLSGTAIDKLVLYDWPGNVRELENIIHQAIVFSTGDTIKPEDIQIPVTPHSHYDLPFSQAKKQTIEAFEKSYLSHLLIKCNGNITRVAEMCLKDRADVSRLVKKYRLHSYHM